MLHHADLPLVLALSLLPDSRIFLQIPGPLPHHSCTLILWLCTVHVCTFVRVYVHTSVCLCTDVCMHADVCVSACLLACLPACLPVCLSVCLYACTQENIQSLTQSRIVTISANTM